MNYFVPNFGVDADILAAQQSEKDAIVRLKGKDALPAEDLKEEDAESPAEKAAIAEMKAKSAKAQSKGSAEDKKANDAPVEAPKAEAKKEEAKPAAEAKIQLSAWNVQDKLAYFMNVETGVDLRSDPNCNSVECLTGHSFPFEEDKKPVLYKDTTGQEFLDEDIKSTQSHLGMSETKLGKWTWNEKKDDDLLNWMPAVNKEAEEKPVKESKAVKKEVVKAVTKPAVEAPKSEAAAVQVESEGMKKPVKKAAKAVKKPVTKKISKKEKGGKSLNKANRQTDNKNWPKHRFHFKNNYKGFPQKRKGRNSARNTMMSNWNTNTYAQKDE